MAARAATCAGPPVLPPGVRRAAIVDRSQKIRFFVKASLVCFEPHVLNRTQGRACAGRRGLAAAGPSSRISDQRAGLISPSRPAGRGGPVGPGPRAHFVARFCDKNIFVARFRVRKHTAMRESPRPVNPGPKPRGRPPPAAGVACALRAAADARKPERGPLAAISEQRPTVTCGLSVTGRLPGAAGCNQ